MIASITILDESTAHIHARTLADKLKLDLYHVNTLKYILEDIVLYVGTFTFPSNLKDSLLEARSTNPYVHLVITTNIVPQIQKTKIIDFDQYPEAFL